jgi:GTP-binding protein HflX
MYYENPEGKGTEVLVNDTIGFIRDLPPNLIKAFSSTLEDSIESDILIHVIDASDPRVADKIEVVEKILTQIGATQKRLNVFNKIDMISEDRMVELKYAFAHLDPIFISANEKQGIDELKEKLKETLDI